MFSSNTGLTVSSRSWKMISKDKRRNSKISLQEVSQGACLESGTPNYSRLRCIVVGRRERPGDRGEMKVGKT